MTPPVIPSLHPLAAPAAPSFTGGLGATGSISDIANTVLAASTGGASLLFGVSASRLVAIAAGLIILTAAIFSFKPVREVAIGVGKNAAKAAVL